MNSELVMTMGTFWFQVVPAAGLLGFFGGILFVSVVERLQERSTRQTWYAGYMPTCDNCKHSLMAKVHGFCANGAKSRYRRCSETR